MIQINLNKFLDYGIIWARVVVTHIMFDDVLVGGVVLYPLGVTKDGK
jgi:hypothetical protein